MRRCGLAQKKISVGQNKECCSRQPQRIGKDKKFLVKCIMIIHPEVLKPQTKKVLEIISRQKFIADFYLAGGTALALQYGHRISVDLEFFCQKNINPDTLINKISKLGKFELLNREENTVEGILDGVKISFMSYPYSLIGAKTAVRGYVFVADASDIAVMKIMAVSGRNTKKDFIDLYCYLRQTSSNLSAVLNLVDKKFSGVKYDRYHIFRALTYFTDAD